MPRGGARQRAGRPKLLETEFGQWCIAAVIEHLMSPEAMEARYKRWLISQPGGKTNVQALEELRDYQTNLRSIPLSDRPAIVANPVGTELEDVRMEFEGGNVRRWGRIPAPNRHDMAVAYKAAAKIVSAKTNRRCKSRQVERACAKWLATEGAKEALDQALFELRVF